MNQKLQTILTRSAVPFCLFSMALLVSLGLIRITVVPLLTRVDVEGSSQSITALLEKHAKLTAELSVAEDKRSALIMPVQDEDYLALRSEQQAQQRFHGLFTAISQLVKESEQEGKQVVVVHELDLNYETRTLRLRGDVRNVGGSSISVLAWFVDSLRSLPLLIDMPTPPFKREQDPYVGIYSPFDIVIPLRVHD